MEARGVGVDISNMNELPTDDDNFTMADVFGMWVLDMVIYGLIGITVLSAVLLGTFFSNAYTWNLL